MGDLAPRLSAEDALALSLAATTTRRDTERDDLARLAATVSPDALLRRLHHHRLVQLLGPRAIEAGVTGQAFERAVEASVEQARRRALLHEALTREVTDVIAAEGMRVMPLKGVALALAAHGDTGARISNDIDVLVAPERLQDAIHALGRLGYSIDRDGRRSAVHVSLSAPAPWRPPVEVHWRLHWYGDVFAEEVLASGRSEDGFLQPAPSLLLAALLLFYARDGFAGLRLLADISGLAERQADALPPDVLLGPVDRDPEIGGVLAASATVVSRLIGPDVAPAMWPLRRRERFATHLADWRLDGDADQINATIRLVDLLLAPSTALRRFPVARFTPFESRAENLRYAGKTVVRWVPAAAGALVAARRHLAAAVVWRVRRLRQSAGVRLSAQLPSPGQRALAGVLRALAGRRGTPAGVILLYHRVVDPAGDPARELVPSVGERAFRSHLEVLRRHYDVVALEDLPGAVAAARGNARPPVAITFDDDSADHLAVVHRLLRPAGVPATFFLNGASLDEPRAFWWERLQELEGSSVPSLPGLGGARDVHDVSTAIILAQPELREQVLAVLERLVPRPASASPMSEAAVGALGAAARIGFHTREHPYLPHLTDEGLREALVVGREALERAAGAPRLRAIAYPHGGHDERVIAAASAAGFEIGVTTEAVPVTEASNRLRLGRWEPGALSAEAFELGLARLLLRR